MVMDTIRIPSPSAILDPPAPIPISNKTNSNTRRTATSPKKKSTAIAIPTNGTQRPKQSKSRNAKRLKCDETKPSCQQCHKRNVTCGGYKKDFKWRPFEETQTAPKAAPKKKASPPPDTNGDESSQPLVMNMPSSQPSFTSMLEEDADDVENIIRQSEPDFQLWPVKDSPPPTTQVDMSPDLSMATMLFQELEPAPGSEESLIVRFDRLTCGILSVKDGVTENPWRNLIWPMARESSALYHAVISMAAFHSSKDNPALRVFGMEHMRRSINFMVQGMGQMQTDAALATTLSLAFAETWDQQTSTGIQHLKGARALMQQTLRTRVRRHPPSDELGRIRFLYNTWLYMDVIARITSMDEAETEEPGDPRFAIPEDGVHDVDPLMGCATTLFPLMGHVANLVQRIRKSDKNSFAIISHARELKNAIDRWVLPNHFNPPEDPQSELQDSIQTAYAYRWAILLYLHQAVPEIPSPSSFILANNTLKLLATVPLSSRTNILHIFPLFVASCEFEDEEDREWIMQRWVAMQNRLRIGNIDRCVEVIREVWRRRDAAKAERLRLRSRPGSRKGSMVIHGEHPSKSGNVRSEGVITGLE
uniref:Acriflavine sensitivity control protein acr-2 n=2 Tax=Talaromyces marneffei PM1 TaxID=1077442 RepID=A0A093V8A2_TALMA